MWFAAARVCGVAPDARDGRPRGGRPAGRALGAAAPTARPDVNVTADPARTTRPLDAADSGAADASAADSALAGVGGAVAGADAASAPPAEDGCCVA